MRVSGSQIVTVGLKRQMAAGAGDNAFIDIIRQALTETGARLLPNTAGCASAREAVQLAHMARELYGTPWIKLEVIGDDYTLQPDPQELVRAAAELAREGFINDYGPSFASYVVGIITITIVYLIFQRNIIAGMSNGAVK